MSNSHWEAGMQWAQPWSAHQVVGERTGCNRLGQSRNEEHGDAVEDEDTRLSSLSHWNVPDDVDRQSTQQLVVSVPIYPFFLRSMEALIGMINDVSSENTEHTYGLEGPFHGRVQRGAKVLKMACRAPRRACVRG